MTRFTHPLFQTTLLISGLFLLSACGGGGGGTGSIDIAAYLPSDSMTKHYEVVSKYSPADPNRYTLEETISVALNAIDGHTVIETETQEKTLDGLLIGEVQSKQDNVYDLSVDSSDFGDGLDRYVDLGDSLFGGPKVLPAFITADDGTAVPIMLDCIYRSQPTELPVEGVDYGDDFLELECTMSSDLVTVGGEQRQFHVSNYIYYKRGIGTVLAKSAWCEVDTQIRSDLNMDSCPEEKISYTLQLLDPADS